jgi:photosystem II stability/assembly factor-like uncharacterized protein
MTIMADDWIIYDHNLTKENLNYFGGKYFIVGDKGVLLKTKYPTYTNHYSEEWWLKMDTPTTENLYGVAHDIYTYIVGSNGTILYYESLNNWNFVNSPTNEDLYSITLSISAYEGFIVGEAGTILYGGGKNPIWYKYESSPTTKDLYSVSGDEYKHISNTTWAVGANGTILDYENGLWSLYPNSPTTNDLYCVSVYSANQAYACGANGTVLLWNGSSWIKVDTTTTENLYSITWISGSYDIFCVGANGTILYSSDSGYHWKKENSPVNVDLHGVGGYLDVFVWGCGDNGTIIHRGKIPVDINPSSIGIIKSIFSSQTIQSQTNKIY